MSYVDRLAADIHTNVHGRGLPEEDRPLYLNYALLGLVLGGHVTAAHVHDAWAAWASVHRPRHRHLRPFGELPPDVRRRDDAYAHAIREVMHRRSVQGRGGAGGAPDGPAG